MSLLIMSLHWIQAAHVPPWELVRLKPTNRVELHEAWGNGGEQMVEDVHIGDNVAIKCHSSTYEKHWILLCDKGLHMVGQAFKDDGGPRVDPRKLGHPWHLV